MKVYLLIILFIFCLSAGLFVYYRYYLRFVLYKDMIYICKTLKSNISFKKTKLKDIFIETNHNISNLTRNIISHNTDNSALISKKDLRVIYEFLDSVGVGDVDFEINNICYYENNFNELKSLSKIALEKEGIMYLKLIIGFGLILCIILI